MQANELRRAFTDFFVARGHRLLPSDTLIPKHPTAPLFTNAGMNQFFPWFLGEETPQHKRVTTAQRVVRLSGKHNDISELGRTRRHGTFFEMLGNFAFGDYFKEEAIAFAWELLTEVIGFDGDRLWATVHDTDDDAEAIWRDTIGLPATRIQRMGEENWWSAGETGPCGPDSEIHYDCGPEWGEEGGPKHGASDRYIEFWNLVFMHLERHDDGSLTELPSRNIDTGAGLERILMLLDGTATVFETDALRPCVEAAQRVTGRRYEEDERTTRYLRILGDHARTMTFLVHDGIVPSNEERGYILRSVIRRAVRCAHQLGVDKPVLETLVDSVVESMSEPYPDLRGARDVIVDVVTREEDRFRRTLRAGSALLDEELARGRVTGAVAFKLHDTFGFPIELTEEVAEERAAPIDRAGFDVLMQEQRERGKKARAGTESKAGPPARAVVYRELVDRYGATEFLGYERCDAESEILEVAAGESGRVEVFLESTPFYAEGGGQIGDAGTITTETGVLRVLDTVAPVPGLHAHLAEVVEGEVRAGQVARASVDTARRDNTRRNHTGTHLLHAALREVLGPHVKQQGSYVGPDRLRFDLSHHAPVAAEELEVIEERVNAWIIANEPVRSYETTMDHARQLGALMFFGDKYGEFVRVVEAGSHSVELCGGTHVHALGSVGPVKILGEGSIGANLRRVEAVTGVASLELLKEDERRLERAAGLLRTKPDEVVEAIERLLQRQRGMEDELRSLRSQGARAQAAELAAAATGGIVVSRRDGVASDELRDLALAVREQHGIRGVVLIGSPDGQRVALVAAVQKDSGLVASELVADAARTVGGGGGTHPEVAVAGGRDASKIDEALAQVRGRVEGA